MMTTPSIPTPAGPWLLSQKEAHLLFMYWPIEPTKLRALVPQPLELDLWEDQAWVGQIPFHMENIHLRWLPAIPGVDQFLEIDFFALVRYRQQPALYFMSLDANMSFGFKIANWMYALPYRKAEMSLEIKDGWTHYRSDRPKTDAAAAARFSAKYRPGAPIAAPPGSRDYFFSERYAFFSVKPNGSIYRGVVHHRPWHLQSVELEVAENTIPAAKGFSFAGDPVSYFSPGRETEAWPPRRYR